ncbi:hypothetical protein MYCTH_2051209 [Thermothelomyces thermophilus ATCC 42464]|uniref:Uncharacterized protein n=1 Tax=Thermothelomyces thermophilus (strain ATCC 42464 / BCRC 31852 / DSM 1799) TaxID=573729 RepID=G2Q303_THET4|nr:uncharacterized protein MYCTH_2051209 [Thermothelomyces thermophilus ATCC 42464]AEO55170.1 hypothetical protein MYCTH_2051209 [Thermothelomyces thermophilus ATCC 42464]
MSWFERIAAEAAHVEKKSEGTTPQEVANKLAQHVPQSFTLRELADATREVLGQARASKQRREKAGTCLVSLLACLRCEDRIAHGAAGDDEDAVKELALGVANVIAPVATQHEELDGTGQQTELSGQELLQRSEEFSEQCRDLAVPGVEILEALVKRTASPVRLDDEVLLTLLAYTDETRPQRPSTETKATADRLLQQQLLGVPGAPTKEQFITETVLQTFLRPLFSKSKPSTITASGRKAEYVDGAASRAESMPDDTAQTKPWKFTDLRTIPAVGWAVREADTQLIAKHWPLFIPVLLTLVDDIATSVRRRGLLILADFLGKMPDRTLHDTGLAKVFEDAVFPTLAFLPGLTPEQESVELLGPAYLALRRLADKQPAAGKDGIAGAPKNTLLDKMLREGVFMGYFHAKEHVNIVEVLCQQTETILNEMGVHAVKHLKVSSPALSASIFEGPELISAFPPTRPFRISYLCARQ